MKTLAPVTFRATSRTWIGELVLPIVFFGVLAFTLVTKAGLNALVAWLGMLLLLGTVVNGTLLPILRTLLTFERSAVEGSLNGRPFRIYYG